MIRRILFTAVITLITLTAAGPPAVAQERTGDDNIAVAVNTEDGTSLFRLAFSVRRVADGEVDQTNTAVALASCTDCVTVALAFQVVLVSGDADLVVPENEALAVNVACAECFTYATATQLVFGFEGPVTLTADGHRRLRALQQSLRELQADADTMTPSELLTAVTAAKQELLAIFTEEVVEPSTSDGPAAGATSTSSTSTTASTSSTVDPTTSTSTTGPPSTTTTTSPTSDSSTPTTAAA